MQEFVYMITPKRENFVTTMTEDEQKIMQTHALYLQNYLEKGNLVLAGPCLDGAFGIAVFRSESLDEAEAIMKNDPAVAQGIMTAKLHPFRISFLQK